MSEPDHIPDDRDRTHGREDDASVALDETLQTKLRTAFGSVNAGDDLRGRIAAAVAARQEELLDRPETQTVSQQQTVLPFPWWKRGVIPAGAAAAVAVMLLAVWLIHTPGVTFASPIEALDWMHLKDIEPCRRFTPETDPARLRTFLIDKLGKPAVVPEPQGDLSYVGGCVRALWNKPAASYLLKTANATASVVICGRQPDTFEMPQTTTIQKHTVYTASHGEHRLAAVRLGEWTYTVVGEIDDETALSLLRRIIDRYKTR
ncbi:MAG: hypothetical protein ACLFV7_09130 [Phycisphaerae bacterium]